MKLRDVAALVALMAAWPLAQAQSSVVLYGTLDLGVQYLSHAGANGGHTYNMQSGNSIPSHFGIKGTEDLGGGYAAYFKLEEGINMANGQFSVPSELFSRYSIVGLSSPYGSLQFGRQYSVMFEQTLFYDPTYLAQYSVMSANLIPVSIVNPNNAVKYISPEIGGVSGVLMYSFGQQIAGDFRAGTYLGVGLSYHNGPFSIRGVFENTRGTDDASTGSYTSGLVDRRASVAAKYALGPALLFAGYANVSGDLQLSPAGNLYWLGANYSVTPTLSVLGEVIRYDTHGGRDGRPMWYVLGSNYFLSKRTYLYAYAGFMDNRGGRDFTLNTYDFSSPGGMSQTGVQLGITHSF